MCSNSCVYVLDVKPDPTISGMSTAIIELGMFGVGATYSYLIIPALQGIDPVTYYWCAFTVLTGIWEAAFVYNYKEVGDQAHYLITANTRVWNSQFNIKYILPWKLPIIFYGEYAAYADREYMSMKEPWARLIESTHALFCGMFSLITLLLYTVDETERAEITLAIAMGTQLMNSILYMGQYLIQTGDMSSPNYNTPEFPCGKALINRPFMYINFFWTAMPIYAIVRLLC
jgi:hypothetical protein